MLVTMVRNMATFYLSLLNWRKRAILCTKITTLCEFCIKQDDPNVSKLRNNALSSENQLPHGPVCEIYTEGREKILKNGLSRLSEIFQVCSEIHGPNTIADAL